MLIYRCIEPMLMILHNTDRTILHSSTSLIAGLNQNPFQTKWANPTRREKVQQKLPGAPFLKWTIKLFEWEVIAPRPVRLHQFQSMVKWQNTQTFVLYNFPPNAHVWLWSQCDFIVTTSVADPFHFDTAPNPRIRYVETRIRVRPKIFLNFFFF